MVVAWYGGAGGGGGVVQPSRVLVPDREETLIFRAAEQTLHHFCVFFVFRNKRSITAANEKNFYFFFVSSSSKGKAGGRPKLAKRDGGFAPEHVKHSTVMEGLLRSLKWHRGVVEGWLWDKEDTEGGGVMPPNRWFLHGGKSVQSGSSAPGPRGIATRLEKWDHTP